MIRIFFAVLLILTSIGSAGATPWQISYEGDDFPENQGWTRECFGPWDRSLEDGILTLDSSADWTVFDYYYMDLVSPMGPGPGEYLYVEWRIKVTGTEESYDNGIYLFNDDGHVVDIQVGPDMVLDISDPTIAGNQASIAPDQFHVFLLTTEDMSSYELYVDDEFAFSGEFVLSEAHLSWIAFGDGLQGGTHSALADWDFMRFGIAPTPSALALFLPGTVALICRRRLKTSVRRGSAQVTDGSLLSSLEGHKASGRRFSCATCGLMPALVLWVLCAGSFAGNTITVIPYDPDMVTVNQPLKTVIIKRSGFYTIYADNTDTPGDDRDGDITSITLSPDIEGYPPGSPPYYVVVYMGSDGGAYYARNVGRIDLRENLPDGGSGSQWITMIKGPTISGHLGQGGHWLAARAHTIFGKFIVDGDVLGSVQGFGTGENQGIRAETFLIGGDVVGTQLYGQGAFLVISDGTIWILGSCEAEIIASGAALPHIYIGGYISAKMSGTYGIGDIVVNGACTGRISVTNGGVGSIYIAGTSTATCPVA